MTRFSSIFAKYGYVAFTAGILCYLLPIVGALAIGLYFLILLCFTILLFIITLGVGFFLLSDMVKGLWSTFSDTTELYNKFVDISIKVSPIISGVAVGTLFLGLIFYVIFAQRRKPGSIVTRSIFLVLSILLLLFSLNVTVGGKV